MVLREYGDTLFAAYPGEDQAVVNTMLDEIWGRSAEYAPYLEHKERPFTGKYVTVTKEGFRAGSDQAPWPPTPENFNIFMFGGSTMFGYGVADADTIPSALQAYLRQQTGQPVAVYNFGSSGYFSVQERVLFEQLLLAGHYPDLAIFLDGLNDFGRLDGNPYYTPKIQKMWETKPGDLWIAALFSTSISKGMLAIKQRIAAFARAGKPASPEEPETAEQWGIDNAELLSSVTNQVIQRYLANRELIKAIASANDIQTLFAWQPIPFFDFAKANYPFQERPWEISVNAANAGYRLMLSRREELTTDHGLLWLADGQNDLDFPLYVDRLHYSARFNQTLAYRIGDEIMRRQLISAAP